MKADCGSDVSTRSLLPNEATASTSLLWKNFDSSTSKLEAVKKQIKGILNKMTPQRFDKLIGQLCEIEMESVDMQEALIALVFEKVWW